MTHRAELNELGEIYHSMFAFFPYGVYLRLGEREKICNNACAEMFGYDDPHEWESSQSFLVYVSPESRDDIRDRWRAMERSGEPYKMKFKGYGRFGTTFTAELQETPIRYKHANYVLGTIRPLVGPSETPKGYR